MMANKLNPYNNLEILWPSFHFINLGPNIHPIAIPNYPNTVVSVYFKTEVPSSFHFNFWAKTKPTWPFSAKTNPNYMDVAAKIEHVIANKYQWLMVYSMCYSLGVLVVWFC